MMNKVLLWYYRHIKYRKLFKEQDKLFKVMQWILYLSAHPIYILN